MRANYIAVILATILLAGASVALAELSDVVVPTSTTTFIFVSAGEHDSSVIGGVTVSSVLRETNNDSFGEWNDEDPSGRYPCRMLTMELVADRWNEGKMTRVRERLDVILPDRVFRVKWMFGGKEVVSPPTRDMTEVIHLMDSVTWYSGKKPALEVTQSPIADKIVIISGPVTAWTGEWEAIKVAPPPKPIDLNGPTLPAPGQPGWDIH